MQLDNLLPIKVVLPRKDFDYRPDPSTGGSTKQFCDVTPELRKTFVESVDKIENYFASSFEEYPDIPVVAKVALRKEAMAKSHRPKLIFNSNTCPVIGLDKPGELLISVNKPGLQLLKRELAYGRTKKHIAQISTLESLHVFSAKDSLSRETIEELVAVTAKQNPIRLRLFEHPTQAVNLRIKQLVQAYISNTDGDYQELDYGEDLTVMAVYGLKKHEIEKLSNFVGTQSLSAFPDYRTVKKASHVVGVLDDKRFPPPVGDAFGIVGVIDTGTDPKNPRLQAYVVTRKEWIDPRDQDNDHGSFVAGIVANGRALNHGNAKFPSAQSKIVDIVALDKNGLISEYDLITVIEQSTKDYPQVKVWNLSLGQATPCRDGRFSLLASKLDSISKKRGILFVIAAGNYDTIPLRSWPPMDLKEADRICPPADSVRGITVGSMAHLSNNAACVGVDSPSPFSRRGPAPHYYLKPEVSHYGGNCDASADFLQNGVVSVSGNGQLAENIGTSFAAPSISTLAANVFRELEPESSATPTLIKAMIVHSAFVRSGRPDAATTKYRGFGSPGDLPDILNCTRSSATVIFHADMRDRYWFDKYDFPMPSCLNVAKKGLNADVFMTLAYDPPTDARYGIEYCRCNVTASLGTVEIDPKTKKEKFTAQLRPAPHEITKGCEENLVKEGYKWSPFKFYHRPFDAGPIDKRWRLHMEILYRSGYVPKDAQKVVLLVTIRDPHGKAPVYDEMVKEMERFAWGPMNLKIASRIREKP